MTHHISIKRSAPIAIAPKPPRPESATPHHHQSQPAPYNETLVSQGSGKFNASFGHGRSGLHASSSRLSPGIGDSASSVSGSPTHSPLPCRACRFNGSRCIMSDDEDGCTSCQANGSECSLCTSPPSRKRKLNGESPGDIAHSKKSRVARR
jgi:hypothetical protein